jgi:hypothetical protein
LWILGDETCKNAQIFLHFLLHANFSGFLNLQKSNE